MKPIEYFPATFRLTREAFDALERMSEVRGLKKNTILNKLIVGHDEGWQKKIAAGGGNVDVYRKGVMTCGEFREAIDGYWLSKLAQLKKPTVISPPEAPAETNGVAEPASNAA